jgi:hypothetical protein
VQLRIRHCGICHAVTGITTGDAEPDPGDAAAHHAWHAARGDIQANDLTALPAAQFPFTLQEH